MTTTEKTLKRSKEGANLAWERYSSAVNRLSAAGMLPGITQGSRKLSAEIVLSEVGFWVAWQLEGGFEGLKRAGLSDAAIYRKVARFKKLFGEHPDVFVFPGLTVDPEQYLRANVSTISES